MKTAELNYLPSSVVFFLESTQAFIDQNNPKRQTADPQWGSPKLDLSGLVYGGLPGVGPLPDPRFCVSAFLFLLA
jgi:hypothetical protein